MSIELVEYEKEIKNMAETVHDVFGIEMIVVDRWLHTIVNTFDYGDNPVDVKINSVVGNIIVTGEPQLIRNRMESEACLSCPDYDRCEMEGVIGVPIIYNDVCLGVIAVLVRRSNKKLFQKAQKVFSTLVKFSEMFVGFLESSKASQAVADIKNLLTAPFDAVEEPVVYLAKDNSVLFANDAFCTFFSADKVSVQKRLISEVVKDRRVGPGKEMHVGNLFVGDKNSTAQIDKIQEYSMDIWDLDRIIYFKLKSPVVYLDRPMAYQAEKKLETFWGPSVHMQHAKEQAINATSNPLPVLIHGPSNSQNRELMKIISRYGPDVDSAPAIIECSNVTDELKHLLFGDGVEHPGHLWPSPCSAICLASVDRMPQYLQLQLLDFVVKQRDRSDASGKLRIYATTIRDLDDLSNKGLFVRDFYQILRQNYIHIPAIDDSYEDREYYLKMYLDQYAATYKRSKMTVGVDFLSAFLQDKSLVTMQSIREFA